MVWPKAFLIDCKSAAIERFVIGEITRCVVMFERQHVCQIVEVTRYSQVFLAESF